MTILVAGATGLTGSAVLTELVAGGAPVRALSRSAQRAAELQRPGVETVAAAFDDPQALQSAFKDVDAAYLATPTDPQMAETEAAFARAAQQAGAHLVKLSTMAAAPDSPLRFGRAHAKSEAAIEAAGGSWTFLRPNGFMQNDLAWAGQVPSGVIAGPVMDASWSIVDVRDIASVAAAVLTDPSVHTGRRIAITGPQARTPRDRVQSLATILGRELTVADVPVPAFAEQLRGYGLPGWQIDGLAELFTLYATGAAAGIAADPDRLLTRPRNTWETFATDHAALFTA